VLQTPNRQALAVNLAFRRVIQLLAAGFFLPGSCGILDPCEVGAIRVHMVMNMEQEDLLCLTAQNLLRVLAHGGYAAILGLDPKTPDVTSDLTIWNDVVVTPLDRAYDASLYERKQGDEEEEDDHSVNNGHSVEEAAAVDAVAEAPSTTSAAAPSLAVDVNDVKETETSVETEMEAIPA